MTGSGDGSDTELVIVRTIDFPATGRFARVKVRLVPESEEYPEGVKYSMHYGAADGSTILRYDNAHESFKGHERHDANGTSEIDFPGWEALLRRFAEEVMNHERKTND